MSSILSALDRSEQERQGVQPSAGPSVNYTSPYYLEEGPRRWPYLLLAAVTFAAGIGCSYFYSRGASLSEPVTAAAVEEGEAQQPVEAIRFLPSEDRETRAMPERKRQPAPVVKAQSSQVDDPRPEMPAGSLQADELAGVSPELMARFQKALDATQGDDWLQPEPESSSGAIPLGDLPADLRVQVPDIRYSSHVYSSNPDNRLIRLNGQELHEGDWLDNAVQIIEIQQDATILRIGPQSFSLRALTDWLG